MANLSTEYMGLKLNNPIVVASCSLTSTSEGVRRCAAAGAGAVVLKSLFEEQIRIEAGDLEKYLWLSGHPEALDYIRNMGMELGPREYLSLIKAAKNALELNISAMPSNLDRSDEEIADVYFRILGEVKKCVEIPIAVKIGPYFTSMSRMADELSERGAAALVLFNRFYQLDIDTEKLELAPGYRFSSPEEMNISLRWISLLAGRVNCDLAASTGIHDGASVIKQLLAGASVAQLCSTLYINKLEQIGRILEHVENWMGNHGFDSVDQVRGKLSQMQSETPESYERLQYIKSLVGIG